MTKKKPKCSTITISKDSDFKRLIRMNLFISPERVFLPSLKIPKDLKAVLKNDLQLFDTHLRDSKTQNEWISVLKKMSTFKLLNQPTEYFVLLKILLYVEQFFVEKELSSHNKENQTVKYDETLEQWTIYVPDLDEDAPFVIIGDTVILDGHRLKIVEIKNGYIIAEQFRKYEVLPIGLINEIMICKISFRTNHISLKCCHCAIDMIQQCSTYHKYLFPTDVKDYFDDGDNLLLKNKWFNSEIQKNAKQKQAVDHIVKKTAKPAPYILFGPPGTGKTSTLVEAVLQILSINPANRVLICTPSNASADEITLRLLKYLPKNDILRNYSASRDKKLINQTILYSSNYYENNALEFPVEILMKKKIIVSTLINSLKLYGACSYLTFSHVFIDEAGQATEPETLIPFALIKLTRNAVNCQFVLLGDHLQLGPVVKSKYVGHLLEISFMERLIKTCPPYLKKKNCAYNPNYITKLVNNFRSHNAILKVPNELFYENELIACGGPDIQLGEDWEHLTNKKFPVIFHAVNGQEYREDGNPSAYNVQEIDTIFHYMQKLTIGDKTFDHKDIGVVTPFKMQEKKIKDRLKKKNIKNVNVGTVQIFQGKEKDVIIMSTVRSRLLQNNGVNHIGFLSNAKRFNVSLTRAKSLLIVVGNPHVLKIDESWRRFLSYCLQNNACFGDNFSLHDPCHYHHLLKPPKVVPKKNSALLINQRIRQQRLNKCYKNANNVKTKKAICNTKSTTSEKQVVSKKDANIEPTTMSKLMDIEIDFSVDNLIDMFKNWMFDNH